MADPFTLLVTSASMFMQMRGASQQAAAIAAAGRNQQTIANYQADQQEEMGREQLQQSQYEATQKTNEAGQRQAAAQRDSIVQKRLGAIAKGDALAAGIGGGATGSDIYGIIGHIGAQSDFRSMTSIYQGEEEANALKDSAALSLYEGENANRAAKTGATLTRAGGQMSFDNSKMEASATRTKGYAEAVSTGSSLYQKYAPAPETINWNPEKFGPYQTVSI